MSSLIVKVRKIKNLEKHYNADKIEFAIVGGWRCIVPKGRFSVGDGVIFVPPDSLLPPDMIERWDIGYLKGKNGRVGTVKLRGEYSEGLILENLDNISHKVDLAELYGITKWEPPKKGPARTRKGRKLGSSNFHKYTDIEHLKNFPDVLDTGEEVYIFEKIHGTNARFGWVERSSKTLWGKIKKAFLGKYVFLIGSRNVTLNPKAKEHDFYKRNVYGLIAKKYNLKEILPKGYTFYGEIYGAGIQDLTYGLKDIDIVFFDIKKNDRYLSMLEVFPTMLELNLPMAPLLYNGAWRASLIDELACGNSELDYSNTLREGIVVRPLAESLTHTFHRAIFKAISKEYLTRKKGTENH